MSMHSNEDVSIVVDGIPPPPAPLRKAACSPGNRLLSKGEGRIGSYAVDKRNNKHPDESRSNRVSNVSELIGKAGRQPTNQKGFTRDAPKGGRDGVRPGGRKDPPCKTKSGSRGKNSEGGGKKEGGLRFSNMLDKRNGSNNKGPSKTAQRIVKSSRLFFKASYDELPECFHIGHNPEFLYPPEIRRAIHNVQFIHTHMVQQDKFDEVRMNFIILIKLEYISV